MLHRKDHNNEKVVTQFFCSSLKAQLELATSKENLDRIP